MFERCFIERIRKVNISSRIFRRRKNYLAHVRPEISQEDDILAS
jgi:hypothetical protein